MVTHESSSFAVVGDAPPVMPGTAWPRAGTRDNPIDSAAIATSTVTEDFK
jgi:hypothetical protein